MNLQKFIHTTKMNSLKLQKIILYFCVAVVTAFFYSEKCIGSAPFSLQYEKLAFLIIIEFLLVVCVLVAELYLFKYYVLYFKQILIFSFIYSLVIISGRIFEQYGVLFPHLRIIDIISLLLSFFAAIIVWSSFGACGFALFDLLNESKKSAPSSNMPYRFRRLPPLVPKFVARFLAISLIYFTWLYFLYPNIATYDSYNQISQAFGWIPLENNNPVFHTLIMRLFLQPVYKVTNSVLFSILLYEILCVLLFSFITTSVIECIDGLFIRRNIIVVSLELFYLVNPLVCWYTVTIWKDVWLSYAVLALLVVLKTYTIKNKQSIQFMVIFFASSAMVLLCKGTGVLYILFLFGALFTVSRSSLSLKYPAIGIIIISLVIYFLSISIVTTQFQVKKHSSLDTHTIIWQTISRTLKYHKDDIPQDQIDELNKFINTEKAAEVYDSKISDPVKGFWIDENYFNDNRIKCIETWLRLGVKYPLTYLEAIYASSFGYYYPLTRYWCFAFTNYISTVATYTDRGYAHDPNLKEYDVDEAFKRVSDVRKIAEKLDLIRTYPFVGQFGSIGFYFGVYFLLGLYSRAKKLLFGKIFLSIPFAVFVGCVLSPVYAEMRYAYPAILATPLLVAIITTLPLESDCLAWNSASYNG